jgi:hypothetical protein
MTRSLRALALSLLCLSQLLARDTRAQASPVPAEGNAREQNKQAEPAAPAPAAATAPRTATSTRARARARSAAAAKPPAPVAAATPAPVVAKPVVAAPPPPPPPTTHDSALLSPPPAPVGAARSKDPAVREMANPTATPESKRDPMGWLGISIKLGVASVAVGKLRNPVYNRPISEFVTMRGLTAEQLEMFGLDSRQSCSIVEEYCQTSGRTGFQLAVALHVGGDGFGWDVEPYLRAGGNAVVAGIYTGPKFDIHVVDPLYLGFGFGGRVGYVAADGWRHGVEIFGRIPVHATLYLPKKSDFALTIEGSFGAGVSGFIAESMPIIDPRNNRQLATSPKIAFGAARSWDISFGVRFP